ncbi:hypothetical protein [Brevundimonas sp.]|uniref:hypothetical protein n=1 Tax=Brevundimonas sp. TaxID=1871086 RepID=UPI002737C90E|nr:hypothetical protein [Brevundimonas sp.]MDP3801303.1 hypothetical protein [Brevundimonas sp.]
MAFRWVPRALALAIAATAALSACARASADSDNLVWPAEVHPGFAVMPRMTGEGAENLNGLFDRLDAAAAETRTDCLATENHNADYARTIRAPFTGPRFLTITVNEDYYCGGAHPGVDIRPMTFDRRTGGLPDWTALWPGGGITASMEGYGNLPAVSRAPALTAWFRAAVRADAAGDAEWLAQCDDWYGDDPVDETVVIWLDAETGGVGMDLASLPHAAMACGAPRIMPIETAARLGASAELVDALREGHAARAFHAPAAE